ncbi:hypothetical protein V5O48_010106 [Marasmius crinis-equi]|uniref:DUF6533 domain-containing protein n=1 Tax=Marasmius crinis-equi TaxID=585013 RepID=A0ABR3F9B1_9AGAR
MSSSEAALFAAVLSSVDHQRLISYFDVCSIALLTYDWLLNLDSEIRYIWRHPSSKRLLQVLFLIQRYLPFFDTAIIYQFYFHSSDPNTCDLTATIFAWCLISGLVICEIILAFRLIAIWQGSKVFQACLAVFFFACWVPALVYLSIFMRAMQCVYLALLCVGIFDAHFENSLATSTSQPEHRTGGRSELINVVYRDGVKYFAFIFLVSATNVVLMLTVAQDLVHILAALERVLHSICTSHAILHIRRVATSPQMNIETYGIPPTSATMPALSTVLANPKLPVPLSPSSAISWETK